MEFQKLFNKTVSTAPSILALHKILIDLVCAKCWAFCLFTKSPRWYFIQFSLESFSSDSFVLIMMQIVFPFRGGKRFRLPANSAEPFYLAAFSCVMQLIMVWDEWAPRVATVNLARINSKWLFCRIYRMENYFILMLVGHLQSLWWLRNVL